MFCQWEIHLKWGWHCTKALGRRGSHEIVAHFFCRRSALLAPWVEVNCEFYPLVTNEVERPAVGLYIDQMSVIFML